jgi:hypothetical protein
MEFEMKALLIGATLASLFAAPAAATIIGGSVTGGTASTVGGVFVKLTLPLENLFGAPDSVGNDNFQSPNLFGFDEDQNILLAAPLTVDVGMSPIPTGTTISSHYIFFDPGPTEQVIGLVNFGSDVLGIVTSTANLAASDFLSDPGVNYLDPALRGLEAGDSIMISGPRQILFDTTASSPGDYVRVLTESTVLSVPESATWAMLLLGFLGVGVAGCLRARTVVRP